MKTTAKEKPAMKKIVALVSVLGLAALAGCVQTEDKAETKSAWNVIDHSSGWGLAAYKVVEIEGHRYIVTRIHYGVSTIHAESCPCKAR